MAKLGFWVLVYYVSDIVSRFCVVQGVYHQLLVNLPYPIMGRFVGAIVVHGSP